jgi:hypothetical protein
MLNLTLVQKLITVENFVQPVGVDDFTFALDILLICRDKLELPATSGSKHATIS